MSDEPMLYHGGPRDGARVELIGALPPAEIEYPEWPEGRYVFIQETNRYEWRLGRSGGAGARDG